MMKLGIRDIEDHVERTLLSAQWFEKHIHADLGLADLAREAGYSLHHFIRVFEMVSGRTPLSFVQQRRLTWAANELLNGRLPIQRISLLAGYESLSAFGRAFRRQYGVSPSNYRKEGRWAWFKDMNPLSEDRLWHQVSGRVSKEPEAVFLPERVLVGTQSVQGYTVSHRKRPWEKFRENYDADDVWELRWATEDQVLNRQYNQVYATSCDGHTQFEDVRCIPEGWYLEFRHNGTGDEDYFHSCNYAYQRWLEKQSNWIENHDCPTILRHMSKDESDILNCRQVVLQVPVIPVSSARMLAQ